MVLKEFVELVAQGDGYKYIAVRRKNGFVGRTGEYWVDNAIGFSWCTRKGLDKKQGQDWNIGKAEVKGIETYTSVGYKGEIEKIIPCAVID